MIRPRACSKYSSPVMGHCDFLGMVLKMKTLAVIYGNQVLHIDIYPLLLGSIVVDNYSEEL